MVVPIYRNNLKDKYPAGAVINLLNLIELTFPSGICLIIRLPILGEDLKLNSVVDVIQEAGGSVELKQY